MLRRDFLLALAGAAGTAQAQSDAVGDGGTPDVFLHHPAAPGAGSDMPDWLRDFAPYPGVLWLRRSGEEFRFDYRTAAGYSQARWALRDEQAGRVFSPSPYTLRLLAWMQAYLAAAGFHLPYNITSGARTVETTLRTEGARLSGQHVPNAVGLFSGVDYNMRPLPTEYTSRLAEWTRSGGVGYYDSGSHTHVDTGRVRTWREPARHR